LTEDRLKREFLPPLTSIDACMREATKLLGIANSLRRAAPARER
jgi:hypothetical protein